MSWAAHDPEGYDKVLVKAVCYKIEGFVPPDQVAFSLDGLEEVIEWIQSEHSKEWEALINWASDKIGEAESDYLT